MDSYCEIPPGAAKAHGFPDPIEDTAPADGLQTAVLAGGCFWCVEAVYEGLDGVIDAVSGYSGGTERSANYDAVCSGATNHAEVVRVVFDARKISFGKVLKVFFSVAHDPTQLNRQGNDRGRQYRSAIFYGNEEQRRVAAAYIEQLNKAGVFRSPIVTELVPLERFYEAEGYHQDYATRNPRQPYIAMVSTPKVEKLREMYTDWLRK
jgi:peptide-methionine (S)-S-oxide reductase